MEPLTIVISFDVGEQVVSRSIPGWIASLVHKLGFDRAKAAFHRGVVPTISLPEADCWWTNHAVERAITSLEVTVNALGES